ncbi:uncharacterized protein LOC119341279 [Triticum dicoccoides]|uniref:BZIP domain-containing protein n=1 Tax=Triticum aestivum TaxID=4565 RepID=A0A3B6SK61_WHEAT|nr:uncharacterized protein LOC119341279 [Triticum dicoccoides]XP_044434166.1 uncharacterized protein LOC123160410 [Triticum aestivum]
MTEEAEAAGIICSLRAADLAGWTPPWKASAPASSEATAKEETAWPAVARGKRTRASRSGSAASKNKGRWARGSPASPLDYSGGSGSGASTSGGEDGAFCSPPAAAVALARGHAGPTTATPASSSAKVGPAGGARRPSIMPVPPARTAGQRSRKKMRLPEVKQLVLSLSAENVGLRREMETLLRACTALSNENGRLETRFEHSSSSNKRKMVGSEEAERRQRKPQQAGGGFALPDLNFPAQDVADAPAAAPSRPT